MRVHRDDSVAVGDLDELAVAARVIGGEDHAPRCGRTDRRPGWRGEIDPRMKAGSTWAERAPDRRLQRPGERDRAAWERCPQGAEGSRAGDAIGRQVRPALELDQGALGVASEAPVDGAARKAVPREGKLELGDVPAGQSGREGTRPQHVPRETPKRAACLRADDAVRGQTVAPLEAHDCGGGANAYDPVDRPPIDVVVPKRHL